MVPAELDEGALRHEGLSRLDLALPNPPKKNRGARRGLGAGPISRAAESQQKKSGARRAALVLTNAQHQGEMLVCSADPAGLGWPALSAGSLSPAALAWQSSILRSRAASAGEWLLGSDPTGQREDWSEGQRHRLVGLQGSLDLLGRAAYEPAAR